MADNEDEEALSDNSDESLDHHFTNYYGEKDGQKSDHLNVKKAKESSTCWPNQKCLAEVLVKRIEFILVQELGVHLGLAAFKSFDIQVRISFCVFRSDFNSFLPDLYS